MGTPKPENDSSGRRLKVTRLIDEYDLDEIGAKLEQRWTAPAGDRQSLRALAEYFNEQLLAAAMADAGMQPLPGEIENLYRLLTADDVSAADRTRATRRLEREGIDVDRLRTDFVTYQAIRSYLTEVREAEYTPDDRDRTAVEAENIQQFRGRFMTVTDGKLKQLRENGALTLGEFNLFADISVVCEDCGSQYDVIELLDRGGCDCDPAA